MYKNMKNKEYVSFIKMIEYIEKILENEKVEK